MSGCSFVLGFIVMLVVYCLVSVWLGFADLVSVCVCYLIYGCLALACYS